MKDLGRRMHCDPSFVTAVADMLEKHGLAQRAAHPGDRRVKHLILTGEGCDLKSRLEAEISARMPWSTGLNDAERAQLLALIRKMLRASPPDGEADPDGDRPGGLTASLLAAGLASAGGDTAGAATDTERGTPSRQTGHEEVEASLGAHPAAG
jgi:hypothetical protein